MTTNLIETMARAIATGRADYYGVSPAAYPPDDERMDLLRAYARAALAAIEAAGYRVVPVEPTAQMYRAWNTPASMLARNDLNTRWELVLAAAPKVTE